MAQSKITVDELDNLFRDAKGKGGDEGGLRPNAGGPVGACTAVTYGNPDRCEPLNEGECTFVSDELERKGAGFAKWRPGNCGR